MGDPITQYGPAPFGGPGPISIALGIVAILVTSWLFGAALPFLTRNKPNDKQ